MMKRRSGGAQRRRSQAVALVLLAIVVGAATPGRANYPAGGRLQAVGDLDGDGRPDVVRVAEDRASIDARKGTDGTLVWSHTVDSEVQIVASIPGAGRHDLLLAYGQISNVPDGGAVPSAWMHARADRITLIDGATGAPLWERPMFLSGFAGARYPIVYLFCSQFSFALCPRIGAADTTVESPFGRIADARAMDDASGDGLADLFVHLDHYLGETALAFERTSGAPIGSFSADGFDRMCMDDPIQPGPDLDGDGRAEVLVFVNNQVDPFGAPECELGARRWDGSFVWRASVPALSTMAANPWVELGDLTGDGTIDLALGADPMLVWSSHGSRCPAGGCSWTQVVLDGSTGDRLWDIQIAGRHQALHVVAADHDGDGGRDLVIASNDEDTDGNNVGDGVRIETFSGATGALLSDVHIGLEAHLVPDALADLNGDGLLDVIVNPSGGGYRGLDGGDLSTIWTTTPWRPYPLGADLNGNGSTDFFSGIVDLKDGASLDLLASVPWNGIGAYPNAELERKIFAADLTDDPGIEVIVGRGAYRFDGTELWVVPSG